jgi:hypothetical protein
MTNKQRAELGEIIIAHARGLFGDVHAEFDVLIADILANLMHACDQGDQMPSFDDCLRIASMHHNAEVVEEVTPEIEKSFGVKAQPDVHDGELSLLQCAENVITAWDEPGKLQWAVQALAQAIHREHFKPDLKLWTIVYDSGDGNEIPVDMCWCRRKPKISEIRKTFPHLANRGYYEGQYFKIEEYSAPSDGEPIIPTIL